MCTVQAILKMGVTSVSECLANCKLFLNLNQSPIYNNIDEHSQKQCDMPQIIFEIEIAIANDQYNFLLILQRCVEINVD